MSRSPQENARLVDQWVRGLPRREYGTDTALRWDMVKVILEDGNPDLDRHVAKVLTGEGDTIVVPFGLNAPVAGDYYPMYQTREGEKWLKAFNEGGPSATWIRIMRRKHDSDNVGTRNDPDIIYQNAPSWDLELRGFQSHGTARGSAFAVSENDPGGKAYWFAVRGGVFYKCHADAGILYTPPLGFIPTDYGQELPTHVNDPYVDPNYVGPAAGDLSAATFGLSAGRIYLAAGAAIWRNQNDRAANNNIRFRLVGSAPFDVSMLCPDSVKRGVLYAAADDGSVARSVSGGRAWEAMGTISLPGGFSLYGFGPGGEGQLVASAYDDTPVMDAGGGRQVNNAAEYPHFRWFVSLDGGATWAVNQRLSDFATFGANPIVRANNYQVDFTAGQWFDGLLTLRPYYATIWNPTCLNFHSWFQTFTDAPAAYTSPPGNVMREDHIQYGHANDLLPSGDAVGTCATPALAPWHVKEYQFNFHPRWIEADSWGFVP